MLLTLVSTLRPAAGWNSKIVIKYLACDVMIGMIWRTLLRNAHWGCKPQCACPRPSPMPCCNLIGCLPRSIVHVFIVARSSYLDMRQ